jgi:putative ABC transport system permease protein
MFRRKRELSDFSDEFKAHLELETERLKEQGMSEAEARTAAYRAFGNVTRAQERFYESGRWLVWDHLAQDVRFGLRQLRRNPGFTVVAVFTLALGIGANTVIFSVLYGAVLDPLPYADSHRLAVLAEQGVHPEEKVAAEVSEPEFLDYQEQNHVFDEVFGGTDENIVMTAADASELFIDSRVTANLFRVLGVPPLMGRVLTPGDGKAGAAPVVVLSHKVWQTKFGGDPGIVGRTIVLNHQPTTVVGVMPPRFTFLGRDMWLPVRLSRGRPTDRMRYFFLLGHLKAGVSMEQAKADVAVLSKRFAAIYPKDQPYPGWTYGLESFADTFTYWRLPKTLDILLGAVGLLLLIACLNVANLMLVRATARDKEFAVRAALGASRGWVVRQLFIESLLLAVAGAALGCVLAWDALGGLVAIVPPYWILGEAVIRINGPVLMFTLGAAVLSTLLFGLAPALVAVRKDLQAPLQASVRGTGESLRHSRLRGLLVVGEVALSLVLLTGAGLLLRSFWGLLHLDWGYNPDNVLKASVVNFPEDRYKTPEQINQFEMKLLRRVRALPGVVSAALGDPPVYTGFPIGIEIVGKPSPGNWSALFEASSDRYFQTVGIPLRQGRTIAEDDLAGARKVAVINQAFVNKYFGGENSLGRQIKVPHFAEAPFSMAQPWFEIVGVVGDIRDNGPDNPPEPTVYIPLTLGFGWNDALLVRTVGDPMRYVKSVGRAAAEIDKEVPLTFSESMRDRLNLKWFAEPRFVMTLLLIFASLGLTLASIGVYSVLSYSVSQRTHEIGVRTALGAEATDVRRMVLKAGLRWLLVGIAIGAPASIALARILQNRIWGIKSADPLTLIAVAALLAVVGLAACYFPARRATKVDPMVALRYE